MPVAAPQFKRSAAPAPRLAPPTLAAASLETYDARRGSSSARGYDWKWRTYAKGYLARHPLCVACERDGVTTAAQCVDHIAPHKGDMLLFWDPANHQALCNPCHSRKTVMEDGGFKPGRVAWHPEWLLPSVAELTIVCGAPGSGKSRYVAARAGAGDVVIDLDAIGAALCGTALHDWPRARIVEVGRERNRQLLQLSERAMAGRRAWFIVSEPNASGRQWWADKLKPAEIIVLETPAAECIRRINSDGTRPLTSGKSVESWWRLYRRRPGDTIVQP